MVIGHESCIWVRCFVAFSYGIEDCCMLCVKAGQMAVRRMEEIIRST